MNIENKFLRLDLDAKSGLLAVADVATDRIVATSQIGEPGVADARIQTAKDPVFGTGQRLEIRLVDDGVIALEVYPELPFALIRRMLVNRGG